MDILHCTGGDLFFLIFHPYHQSVEILFPNPGDSVSNHRRSHITEFGYINEKKIEVITNLHAIY